MLIDHLIRPPGSGVDRALPAARKVGDVVIGEREAVTIQGRPMLLWGKCSPVYDASGQMIAAIEAIAVSESLSETDNDGEEVYLGGISSLTLKILRRGGWRSTCRHDWIVGRRIRCVCHHPQTVYHPQP